MMRAIELLKLEFESSSLEFVSNKSPMTINNNTIYSNDANNPQGIRDDPKFNYRVNQLTIMYLQFVH